MVSILPALRPYFSEEEYSLVENKQGNVAQVDELVKILLTKENRHFNGFCHTLERNGYRHWAQQLRADAGVHKEEAEEGRHVH